MSAVQAQPLPAIWKERLDLAMRRGVGYRMPRPGDPGEP